MDPSQPGPGAESQHARLLIQDRAIDWNLLAEHICGRAFFIWRSAVGKPVLVLASAVNGAVDVAVNESIDNQERGRAKISRCVRNKNQIQKG